MNADRREEKPTGGGRQRMKPAWKEQTGGLREEGKSKMAHNFRNEVRKLNLITSSRPNGSESGLIVCDRSSRTFGRKRKVLITTSRNPTERKSTELIARICAIWQSVTGFRSSECSTVDSLTTEILNKFFYLPCGEKRA